MFCQCQSIICVIIVDPASIIVLKARTRNTVERRLSERRLSELSVGYPNSLRQRSVVITFIGQSERGSYANAV